MRACKVCGILLPFDSKMNVPKHYAAGRICKICYKHDKRAKGIELYKNGNQKAKMCKEPDKKECVICSKSFWTAYKIKKTCSDECASIRKKEMNKEWRLKNT